MDSLDFYHGLSGLLPWTQRSFTMDSGQFGQSPVSPWTKSSETSQTGGCPLIQWTLSMDPVDSLDIVHGQPVRIQVEQTKSTESMD